MLKPPRTLLARILSVCWSILIGCLVISAQPVLARPGLRSLEHLSTVRVIVEDLNRTTQQLGLQKERIFNLAAQQLIKDGLVVLKPEVRLPVPIVYVRLSSAVGGTNPNAPVSFYLTVQVRQLARLANGRKAEDEAEDKAEAAAKPHLVTTWENGAMVLTNPRELAFYTQNVLINLLGDLMHDYQQASAEAAS